MTKPYPMYGSTPETPGLYLGLFHGRPSLDEDMEDWGENGALIGPLEYVHTTYNCEIKIQFVNPDDILKYPQDESWGFTGRTLDQFTGKPDGFTGAAALTIEQDCLYFDGKYYGDWTVYYVHPKKEGTDGDDSELDEHDEDDAGRDQLG